MVFSIEQYLSCRARMTNGKLDMGQEQCLVSITWYRMADTTFLLFESSKSSRYCRIEVRRIICN